MNNTNEASLTKCAVYTVFPSTGKRVWKTRLLFRGDGRTVSIIGVLSRDSSYADAGCEALEEDSYVQNSA